MKEEKKNEGGKGETERKRRNRIYHVNETRTAVFEGKF